MICVALALVHVGCQHVHYTAIVIMYARTRLENIAAFWWVLHRPCQLTGRLFTCYFALPCPVTHVIVDRHLHGTTRDGPLPKVHTLDGACGATRGYYSHGWDESTPVKSDKTKGVQPETLTDADVETVDARDKNQGKAATNDAVGSTTANTTVNSAGDAATEKDATMRRLGELHRLLKSRKRKPQCHRQEEHRSEWQGL